MKSSSPQTPEALAAVIERGQPRLFTKRRLLLATLAGIALLVGLSAWRSRSERDHLPPPFATEPLKKGDLSLTITATGNLEPTNKITVGSELSGMVQQVFVDVNDHVTKGQPLAKLDTTKVDQQIASGRADVASARATIAQAEATLKEKKATLARQLELQRVSGGKLPSQADLDAATAAADGAVASLDSAHATLSRAESALRISENDLEKSVIKSPVDGLVLTRSIDPGQTVAASFNAPELFVIAENLQHMKLKVTVAEADIGRVVSGLSATFTVDAWPERVYHATVQRVAFGSSTTNNVVTYETDLSVENEDLSLRPGMTATADIRVADRHGVFLVPAAALRFTPPVAGSAGVAQKKSFLQSILPMPPRRSNGAPPQATLERPAPGMARLYVDRGGEPVPLLVKTSLSDGRRTEISGEELTEGLAVIVRANSLQP